MIVYHMTVDQSEMFLIINGDEVSSSCIDESCGIDRHELSHHSPEYVDGWFTTMGGTGRFERIV